MSNFTIEKLPDYNYVDLIRVKEGNIAILVVNETLHPIVAVNPVNFYYFQCLFKKDGVVQTFWFKVMQHESATGKEVDPKIINKAMRYYQVTKNLGEMVMMLQPSTDTVIHHTPGFELTEEIQNQLFEYMVRLHNKTPQTRIF